MQGNTSEGRSRAASKSRLFSQQVHGFLHCVSYVQSAEKQNKVEDITSVIVHGDLRSEDTLCFPEISSQFLSSLAQMVLQSELGICTKK